MAVLIRNYLRVEAGRIQFDLYLREPIVTSGGDSSTGKTILLKYVKAWQGEHKFEDILVIDDYNHLDEMKQKIKGSKQKLIIIDYADSMLPLMDLCGYDFIADQENQYLIFTRSGMEYGARDTGLGKFVQNDNTIRISYLITRGVNA